MELYPFLSWETKAVESSASASETFYQLVSVSATNADGTRRWTFTLPPRMHPLLLESSQVENLRRLQAEWIPLVQPRHGTQTWTEIADTHKLEIYGPWYDIIYRPEAIFIGDSTGVLVLDPTNGNLLLDYHPSSGHPIYDRGEITIEEASPTGRILSERKNRPSNFLIPCKEWVIYFNGSVAAVLSSTPPSVIDETLLRADHEQAKPTRKGWQEWIIPVGPVRIHLLGMNFMK